MIKIPPDASYPSFCLCLGHLIKPQNTNPFHRISLQDFICTGIFGSSSLGLQTTIHFKEIISEIQSHKRYVNT